MAQKNLPTEATTADLFQRYLQTAVGSKTAR